ncbi:hypothetical protein HanRHA438_Chr17g0812541 [Helianthus annuus]|nr:hypothetical protein HanHA300_Chr17g0654011 [Helianthus annuus]KAJ0447500.1 hypothetical protein HanHA89_Chr17g0706101 [Helianthus annuus]KAJ0632376.1 hypothetical protein HanLR1_Chr17g0664461 [Helianthus annuus]KAJ0636262.1 hypothetical protein HanOQP8_Chr17g0659961 [Helianthus annuus]KAJ0826278.1 hypothetical protein HanRHA438_Chr17g0812541 [Helianthus annuus]
MRWCITEENDQRHMQGHIIYQSIWHILKKEPNMSCNMLRWSMSSIKHAQIGILYVGIDGGLMFIQRIMNETMVFKI